MVATRTALVPLVVAALVLEAVPAMAAVAQAPVVPSEVVTATAPAPGITTATVPAPIPLAAPSVAPGPAVVSAAGLKTNRCSWYGPGFYGHTMAGGGNLRPTSMVMAHRSLPFGTRVLIVYRGRAVVAVVNDRGPFVRGRNWDLGPGVARALKFGGVNTIGYKVVSRTTPIGPVVLAAGYPRIAGVTTAKTKKAVRRHARHVHRRVYRKHRG
jgi:rare lipoprotein A